MADQESKPPAANTGGDQLPAASPANEDPEDIPAELLAAIQRAEPEQLPELIATMSWKAPIPPPAIFKQYPDFVQRQIADSWSEESKHRRSTVTRGQLFAFAIALASIAGGVICAALGQPWVGGAIGVAGVGVIAATSAVRLVHTN